MSEPPGGLRFFRQLYRARYCRDARAEILVSSMKCHLPSCLAPTTVLSADGANHPAAIEGIVSLHRGGASRLRVLHSPVFLV